LYYVTVYNSTVIYTCVILHFHYIKGDGRKTENRVEYIIEKTKGSEPMKKIEELSYRNVLSVELVAAYVRVSTQEQKLHGLSLDAQKMKLTEYAEENNMKIVEWYVDEGVSGRKLIKNRPELQRMIQDAEKSKFDRIIFIKLDRFFRSVAEYHECMKRISPVIWSTTEEEYDLTTANGRMLVNMKLTIAEMEADQTGERIDLVNEYKVSTGQPLSGSQPFGFTIETDKTTGRKKIVRDPDDEPILRDAIQYCLTHQSKKKTLVYLHAKHHISMSYNSLSKLFANTMLYGAYRDNPVYCEAYIDKETFDRLQEITRRNVKDNTSEDRAYIFSGLIFCPHCKRKLSGGIYTQRSSNGTLHKYKKYRCANCRTNNTCDFNKVVAEKTLERMLLANIEKLLDSAKIKAATVSDSDKFVVPKYDIEEIHEQIDRLNYSWQTGKIRKVEQYEKDYAELMEKLEEAEAEQGEIVVKDFSKIEAILQDGWQSIYNNLDDAHKRAFWRSFVKSIEINWTTEKKEITAVNFF
jgi:DNA invertase Pin-like site-specific DNA recombinase